MPRSKQYKSLKEDHQRFSWTRPVGYDFESVENAIADYDQTIKQIKGIIEQKDKIIEQKDAEIRRLGSEITRLQIQLESFKIPENENANPIEILNEFAGSEAFSEEELEENTDDNPLAGIEDVKEEKSKKKMDLPPIIQ